jgi:uncharacterized protein YjgD (DUF1641 family)
MRKGAMHRRMRSPDTDQDSSHWERDFKMKREQRVIPSQEMVELQKAQISLLRLIAGLLVGMVLFLLIVTYTMYDDNSMVKKMVGEFQDELYRFKQTGMMDRMTEMSTRINEDYLPFVDTMMHNATAMTGKASSMMERYTSLSEKLEGMLERVESMLDEGFTIGGRGNN